MTDQTQKWFKAASCEGKHPYPSRKRAAEVAKRYRKKKGQALEPYKCDFCGNWHIGTPSTVRAPKVRTWEPRKYQDRPTPERKDKGVWEWVDTKEAGRKYVQDVTTAPIDDLEFRGVIDNDQASAGRAFEELWRAQNEIHAVRDSCLTWMPKGFDNEDGPVEAAERWRKLCRHLGMLRENQLRWVCVQHNMPKPRDIGALREALNEAVRFFK